MYISIRKLYAKKLFCNKKFSGIIWAFIVGAFFMGFSILGLKLMPTNVSWYIYSSVLRIIFGFISLSILNKFLGRSIKDVLSFKNPKLAFIFAFVMAVIYMKSKNIILPMILHFVEDVFANLFSYTLFNNLPLFENLFTAWWYVNIVIIIYSVVILSWWRSIVIILQPTEFTEGTSQSAPIAQLPSSTLRQKIWPTTSERLFRQYVWLTFTGDKR